MAESPLTLQQPFEQSSLPPWSEILICHHRNVRTTHPDTPLIVLFEVDGTILDHRHTMLELLQLYDRFNQSSHFAKLTVDQLSEHELEIEVMLKKLSVPVELIHTIAHWYRTSRWWMYRIMTQHVAATGIVPVLNWLKAQSNTFIGINTSRPEYLHEMTFQTVNRICDPYQELFGRNMIFMSKSDYHLNSVRSKVAGINFFTARGYKVMAFVDNDTADLDAVARKCRNRSTLFLSFTGARAVEAAADCLLGNQGELVKIARG